MTICIGWRSGFLLAAVLFGLVATPRELASQAEPDLPDLVQSLSQQSYQESLIDGQATAPQAVAEESQIGRMRKVVAAAGLGFRCLPTCNTLDGRFMAVAGANLITLSGRAMDLQISVPAGSASFQVGIFDGDVRATDGAGVSHWDIGVASVFEYTLYADPFGDGTGTTVVEMQPGSPSIFSSSMPDNAWIDFTVATGPAAQTPSGNYFYRLSINLTAPALTTLNAFKVRATAVVSGLTLDPEEEPFSYIASFTSVGDAQTVYPNYPSSNTPTNYDGNFDFYFDLPVSKTDVAVWDGDFDRGKYDGTERDTDDPDTPGLLFVPPWATIDTLPEGVALGILPSTGNPPDDRNPTGTGLFILKPPSVRYDLSFPDGQSFANENPSGNQEWEQFKVSTDTSDPLVDHHTASIPAGTYRLRVAGVDMQNLNALLLPGRALCVEEDGAPCVPLRPFLVGDTVFLDGDGDGVQGAGEAGLSGVELELVDSLGMVLATATTDGDGRYSFPVESETYEVRVAAINYGAGGPLDGYISTTGDRKTETVVDDNVLVYDFGFRGTGSLGDRLWLDLDADGIEDAGEDGLTGVRVELLDDDGDVIASTTTGGDGEYSFDHLAPGTYTVRVDETTLPEGAVATYDLDGTGTAHRTAVALAAGEDRTDVDFGYRGTGAIGDLVWYDKDADGILDAGEPALSGTTVELLDGSGTLIAATTTGSNGFYTFSSLLAGSYTVRVVASTLPVGGLAPTHDLDGTGTAHTAAVTLAGGQARADADFGYRGTLTLGDRVWQDLDGDGAQEAGEPGINGVTVRLFLGSAEVASTVTAGDGNYSLSNLPATTFTVRIDTATLPAGVTPTHDLDGPATPHQATVDLTASRTDADFGYRPPLTCTGGYFKDHFSAASFSNNDGTLSWSGAWIESDVAGTGLGSGNVTIGNPYGGYLFLRDYPDTGTQPSAARQVNLSGFASATLSFSFHVRTAVDPDDAVAVEVSSNGGASYAVVETLNGFSGTSSGSRSYDISAHIASNTRIRFRVSNNYGAGNELFKLDWVRIDGSCPPSTRSPGTGTIGYWKNHPEAWPVQQITAGGKTYPKSQAISWMSKSSGGDKTIDLFKQLVAAKLNVLGGNEASCISAAIASADAWLVTYPLGSKVKASSNAWTIGGSLHERLDDYNKGELCAPHRD